MVRLRFSALLMFLLPALIVLAVVAFLNIYILNEFTQAQSENSTVAKQTVEEFSETIGFIDSVGVQYKRLNELLLATNQDKLTHAAAYRIHSKMVDQLDATEKQLARVKTRLNELLTDKSLLDPWQANFVNFKNFSLMASDIVVIDPETSSRYINAAQVEYFKFVDKSNKLAKQLSNYTNQTFEETQERIENSLHSIYYVGLIGFLVAFLIAVVSASRLSNYLQIIMASLRDLAAYKREIPKLDQVNRMVKQTKGELRLLGHAVLKFKHTLELSQKEEAQIFQLAYFDTLTELPNMQMLLKDLDSQLKDAYKEHLKGVLVKLDINRFQVFNNALGYDFGDKILVEFAKRLSVLSEGGKQLYRSSADEFFILIAPTHIETGKELHFQQAIADKVKNLLSAPFKIDNEIVSITCNQGIVSFPTGRKTHDQAHDLIRNAMIALRNSKDLGNNQSVIYRSEFYQQITDAFELQKDLEVAIENNDLELYLQSQIHPHEPLPRAEALIRWQHPKRGWISPEIFIALAEESNLIIEVDKWMLTEACKLLVQQRKIGRQLHISVNISGQHFSHPNFLEHMLTIFASTGVDPRQVTLELTENIFLDDFDTIIDKMQELKTRGVRFSIDDFGTGYSSLSYLKRLPVDEVKVDRSFVQKLTDNEEDQSLVKSVFEIAQSFNLEVVVEGVETSEQEVILNQLGEPIIQGYLYARPVPYRKWLDTLPN
ncbi:bifunctional diguanylate cyclase/phosphodiesterase [Thiomicrorhabdus sp. 6S3-12]|uniref:putative bifunctional diguanylate cyclase/phosphodiesterase n=1 Tax=Thiomicrorhabdus sp. 6S3-12 TaxID=2819681 RepID=UPI001AAC5292|nr:bifunctional diguanylate cyclase/phosphodiesterase [Thiomicrorhabdus sp. 6S3-12]MBO1924705.1 EAL domain-containing protein [Thiomicrorhabdus sp. 6S3-12]